MPDILGYTVCRCGTPERREVAWKTGGLCSDCFRDAAMNVFAETVLHGPDGMRLPVIIHRSQRSPGDRAQRARSRKAAKRKPTAKQRHTLVARSERRAKQRLAKMFPGIYELLLAIEREQLGLEGWTIERCLTSHRPNHELDMLLRMHGIDCSHYPDAASYDHSEVP
jgi:beta-phosphoglucomutase-like phosphatase (HAD superfamily)